MSNDNSPGPVTFSDPASSGMHLHRSNGLAFAEGASLLGVVAVLDYTGLLSFELVPVHPYLFVVTRWAKGVGVDLAGLDHLERHFRKMHADAGVQRALAAEGLE